jgi:hypothetical protein
MPGLESAKRVVVGLSHGSAVQCVLFYGIRGAGKAQLARVLAKAWLCKEPGSDGACGECQACLSFERDRCADYLTVSPVGTSRIIRLGAMIETDPDDQLYPIKAQLFLRTPPLAARSKVVVIEDADRLNPRAANSLLKTLEEPPPYARFILLTDVVGSILPTILSRSLAVACELPDHLEGVEPWALAIALGAPGRASELQEFSAVYRPIYEFGLSMPGLAWGEALVVAEYFAGLADRLQAVRKMGARAADAEALEVLATSYSLLPNRKSEALHAIIEAHRRILGNANASSAYDSLFATALRT